MSEQAGRYQRTFSGMIGAMVVLVVLVVAFVVLRNLNTSDPENPAPPVDWKPALQFAREQAPFPVLAPQLLPPGWEVTSADFEREGKPAWHLGMLTDDKRYMGLEQAKQPVADMVSQYVDEEAKQGRDVGVDGLTWQSWSDPGGDHALTRRADGVTTLVVGSVPADEVATFAASLQ